MLCSARSHAFVVSRAARRPRCPNQRINLPGAALTMSPQASLWSTTSTRPSWPPTASASPQATASAPALRPPQHDRATNSRTLLGIVHRRSRPIAATGPSPTSRPNPTHHDVGIILALSKRASSRQRRANHANDHHPNSPRPGGARYQRQTDASPFSRPASGKFAAPDRCQVPSNRWYSLLPTGRRQLLNPAPNLRSSRWRNFKSKRKIGDANIVTRALTSKGVPRHLNSKGGQLPPSENPGC